MFLRRRQNSLPQAVGVFRSDLTESLNSSIGTVPGNCLGLSCDHRTASFLKGDGGPDQLKK